MIDTAVIDAPGELYTAGKVIPMASKPSGTVTYIECQELTENIEVNSIQIEPYHVGTINASIDTVSEYQINNITFTSSVTFDESIITDTEWQQMRHLAIIDSEIICFQDLLVNGGGSFTLTNCIRGVFNSTVASHNAGAKIWLPSGNYNLLNTTTIDQTIRFSGKNAKTTGAYLDVPHTYTSLCDKPYNPSYITGIRNGDTITINWETSMRQRGATYYDASTITVGTDAGQLEGAWDITWATGNARVSTPSFTRVDASSQTYVVKSVLNGFYSSTIQITI
jgi:hypothetical protein